MVYTFNFWYSYAGLYGLILNDRCVLLYIHIWWEIRNKQDRPTCAAPYSISTDPSLQFFPVPVWICFVCSCYEGMKCVICAAKRLTGYQLTSIKEMHNTGAVEHITADPASTDKQPCSIKMAPWHRLSQLFQPLLALFRFRL